MPNARALNVVSVFMKRVVSQALVNPTNNSAVPVERLTDRELAVRRDHDCCRDHRFARIDRRPRILPARKRSQESRILNDLRLVDGAIDMYAIALCDRDVVHGERGICLAEVYAKRDGLDIA